MARRSVGSLPIRSIAGAAFAGAIAAGALAGCGHVPPQTKEHPSISGVNASIGNIDIRNAQVTLGANGNAILTGALFNRSDAVDALTFVSSDAVTSTILPSGPSLDVPSENGVFLTSAKPLVLVGLKSVLVGADIPVQLTFKSAGTVTLQLPIVRQDPALRVGPSPSASASATTPSATASKSTPTPSASATR